MHKMIHNILNVRAAVTYIPYQDLENKRMMLDMLDKPTEFIDHIRRYANSLTTQMVFGFRTVRNNDPQLKQLFHVRLPCLLRVQLDPLKLMSSEFRVSSSGGSSFKELVRSCLTSILSYKHSPRFFVPTITTLEDSTKTRWLCILVTG